MVFGFSDQSPSSDIEDSVMRVGLTAVGDGFVALVDGDTQISTSHCFPVLKQNRF